MRRRLYYILAAVAAWAAFLGVTSALPVLSGAFPWAASFRMTLNQWLPWMVLSPGVLWLTARYPMEWAAWRSRVLLHGLMGFLTVMACAWGSEHFFAPTFPPFNVTDQGPRGGPPPFAESDLEQPLPPMDDRPPPGLRDGQGPPLWARAGFNVPIYLALAGFCHAFVYFHRSQARERRALALETQLGQARLQALRMQLQPHFLFNTLNAISTLVQSNPPAAQEMIGSLGQMLRLSLDSAVEAEVPLEQELKFLDCYLEIAKTRFGDRLAVKQNVAPETRPALVPTFVLQPLVENAIKHGIEPADTPGTVEITIRRVQERLVLSIRDTGVGLAQDDQVNPFGQNGIGLANTQARLQNMYPGQYRFAVRNVPAGGCVAELEIPFHTEPLSVNPEAKA